MSHYWTPAAVAVSVSSSVVSLGAPSSHVEGLARIFNAGASVAFVSFVTAAATAAENKRVPIAPNGVLFLAYGAAEPGFIAVATATASALYVQAGYARI